MKIYSCSAALLSTLFFISLIFSPMLSAHNVVGGVYVNGFNIEGEAGFSNGSMANAGTVVKVSDQAGIPLGEVITDDEGFFVFTAKKRITHVFEINMGAGHTLKMQLPAEELPDSLDPSIAVSLTADENAQSVVSQQQVATNNQAVPNNQITSLMLEKAIAKQIKPLRREIRELKEKSGLRDIIGGIGYIFGLLGLVAFLRDRKLKASK